MNKDSIVDLIGFILIRSLSLVCCLMPLRPALWIGRCLGNLACFLNTRRRAIGYANLKAAFPGKKTKEINGILRAHYESLGMNVVELLKVPVLKKHYLDKYIELKGFDIIENALKKGKGIILLAAHFGNWEIASLAANSRGHSLMVFARDQKYNRLNKLLIKYREMSGCKIVSKGFAIRGMVRALKDNRIIGMLADQNAGANGVFVNFMHRPASTAQGPVNFALKTGASIVTCFIRRQAGFDRHVIDMGGPVDLVNTGDKEKDMKKNLDKITDITEAYIRKYPDQWLWSHKRWKLTPERTVLVLSDGKPGHLNQSQAAAEMVEDALGSWLMARGIQEKPIVKIKIAKLEFKNKFARMLLDVCSFFAGPRCQGCLRCLKVCLKKTSFDEVKNRYADIIISCGASTAGTNIFLKYENNAKNAAIMKPGLGRAGKFDLIILPRHDEPLALTLSPPCRAGLNLPYRVGRGNMLITEAAPNRMAQGSGLVARGIGVLIGGDAKNFKLEKKDVEKTIDGVFKIAEDMDRDVFISTSRRTSPEIDSLLKERLKGNERCKLLVIANEKNIKGAVQKILDSSELVVVSPESISMISEAVSAKRRVVVFGVQGEAPNHSLRSGTGHGWRVKGKYGRNLENLEKQGYIKTASAEEIYDTIKQVLKQRPALKELGDRSAITQRLQALM